MFIRALTLILLCSHICFATIEIVKIEGGFSNKEQDSSGVWTIYGGSLGTDCEAADPTNIGYPCDSCQSYSGTVGCNHSYVASDAAIVITISSSSAIGKVTIATSNSTETGTEVVDASSEDTITSAGGNGKITITWDQLCVAYQKSKGNTVTDCSAEDLSETFYIGVDDSGDSDEFFGSSGDDSISIKFKLVTTNNSLYSGTDTGVTIPCSTTTQTETGICDFSVFPGDEKIYLLTAISTAAGSFPTASDLNFSKLVIFYESGASCSSFPGYSSDYNKLSLTINSTDEDLFTLSKSYITGLENGDTYCFSVGVEDEAGNISGLSKGAFSTDDHRATPDEVLGLLEEGNCYIATASYGSPLAKELNIFRAFRDKILMHYNWGKSFVDFYYSNSKPYALKIAKNPNLRFFSRLFLWPALGFAWLSVQTNLYIASFLLLLFVVTSFFSLRTLWRKLV